MFRSFNRRLQASLAALFVAVIVGSIPTIGSAQLTEDLKQLDKLNEIQQPLATICLSGVQGTLDDVRYMFSAVDRNDMMDVIQGAMDRVGNLKGFDQTKPMGVFVYLGAGLPPTPQAVGFIPVDNLNDLTKTLEVGNLALKKNPEGEGRYDLVGPNRTFYVQMKKPYAFVTTSADALDRNFPDPIQATRKLTERFDLGVRLNIATIPQGIRSIFMTFLRSSAQAEMQQRDEEPEGAYLVRRANAESTLILVEQLITQCNDLLIGFNASPEDRSLTFDVDIEAQPDSKFAEYLDSVGGKASYFASLLDEQSPFTFSASWNMDEREKKSLKALLDFGKEAAINEFSDPEIEDGPINSFFESLQATADAGHIDLIVQMVPVEEKRFVLVGGMRLAKADAMSGALRDLVGRMSELPALKSVDLDVDSHQGITFHRIQGAESRPEDDRMYGENSGLFIGTGSNTVWFSAGSDRALDVLKETIDLVTDSLALGVDRSTAPPFQIVSNITEWFVLREESDSPSRGRELAEEAFKRDNDQIRLEFRPTENGARFRIRMEEGFIRMIGLGTSNRFDRSQL